MVVILGTLYGAGVYFAPKASTSVQFCNPDDQGSSHIFSVQVLTGVMCQGHGNLKVLPAVPRKGHVMYDSAADNPSDPSEIVIFHDSQAYPSYHVVFKSTLQKIQVLQALKKIPNQLSQLIE